MITFHSIDSDGNKVIFTEKYIKKDNIIIFNDKSAPNTQIELTINDDLSLLFCRKGDIDMYLPLAYKELKIGHYKNSMGLEFDLKVYTTSLRIEKNKISIEYDLEVETIKQHHKIWILIH